MANSKPYLQQGQFLSTNDFLFSPSGYFNIFMQGDGNLVVYRAGGGGALANTGKTGPVGDYCAVLEAGGLLQIFAGATPPPPGTVPLFSSQKTGSSPSYYAVVQDDGNFCIYPGTDPTDQQSNTPLYTFNKWDPVVNVNVTDIEYDVQSGTLTNVEVQVLVSQTLTNGGAAKQTGTFTGSNSLTTTQMWQNSTTLTAKVTVSTEYKAPVAGPTGKIEASIQASDTLTFNKSTSTTTTYTIKEPVNVPPNSSIVATASVTTAQMSVPFTITATITYQSGVEYTGQFPGVYTGGTSYNLTYSFEPPKAFTA